jgi:hypothetical protein
MLLPLRFLIEGVRKFQDYEMFIEYLKQYFNYVDPDTIRELFNKGNVMALDVFITCKGYKKQ